MSKSVFKLPNVRNHTQRNGFDLSQKNAFTAKAGELLPVYFKFALPGDKFNLKVQHFTRTPAVQTCAFTRIQEEFRAFFVPLRLLWRYFPYSINRLQNDALQFATNISGQTLTKDSSLPHTSLAKLLGLINSRARVTDVVGLNLNYQSTKLLNYLGYMWTPDAYNRSVLDGQIPANPFTQNLQVSVFPLLAYQKIYQDFYRNTRWEKANASAYNVDYIEPNDFASTDLFPLDVSLNYASVVENGMLTLRYVNYQKDVFTGVLPNSQQGDVSVAPIEFPSSLVQIQGSGTVPPRVSSVTAQGGEVSLGANADSTNPLDHYIRAPYSMQDGTPLDVEFPSQSVNFNASFNPNLDLKANLDILELRKAQATQKLREITIAHEQTLADQQHAHWGVDLPDTLNNSSIFIGSTTSNVDINEVVNQNLYGNDNNGKASIAGKATSYGDDKLGDFTCQEFGIVMVLYSATPVLDYQAIGTDLQLVKTDTSDFPVPEFDKLGLDTIPNFWLANSDKVNNVVASSYGYFPRYADFKTAPDLVRGEFLQSLQSWVAPVGYDLINNTWFSSSRPSWRSFKVNPSILNPIFGVSAQNGTDSDQFYVNSYFDVKVQRRLDVSGMPY